MEREREGKIHPSEEEIGEPCNELKDEIAQSNEYCNKSTSTRVDMDEDEIHEMENRILQYNRALEEMEDMNWVINYHQSYRNVALRNAQPKSEKMAKSSKNLFKHARCIAGLVQEGDGENEAIEVAENETPDVDEIKAEIIDKIPDAEAKTSFNKKLIILMAEVQKKWDSMMERRSSLRLANSLAYSTVTSTPLHLNYWVLFVAATPGAEIDEFCDDQIDQFFEFLDQQPVQHGPINRIGKRLEASTICGIMFGVHRALRLLGYLPTDKPFNDCISKEKMKEYRRNLDRTEAKNPIIRYPIFPSDVLWVVGQWKIDSHKVHQAALYLLMKSATMLRESSLIATYATNSPGMRLGDVEFSMENSDGRGSSILSARVKVKYEKQNRQSGAANYDGRKRKLQGSNSSTCVVKFLFLQCLYLDAFEDDCAEMFNKNEFRMKKDVLGEALFRCTDSYGQFTIHQLRADGTIMDLLADTLGLPRMCVSGHCLRHGTAMWLADTSIKNADGASGIAAISSWISTTGQWSGGGWKRYVNASITEALNMTGAAFGSGASKENLRDVYNERHALFGLSKERRITPDHPAIIRALEKVDCLKQLAEKEAQAREERIAKQLEVAGTRYGKGVRYTQKERSKIDSLPDAAKKQLALEESKYRCISRKFADKKAELAKHLCMYANMDRVERKKENGTGKRKMEIVPINIDIRKMAVEAEKYMKTEAKFLFCPVRDAPTEVVKMKCYAASCTSGPYNDVQSFLRHMFHAHGITMHHSHAFGRETSNDRKKKSASKTDTFGCWGTGSSCATFAQEKNNFSSLALHLRDCHHRYFKCETCGKTYSSCGRVKHMRSDPDHVVKRITNFLNYNEFIETRLDGDGGKCVSEGDSNGEEIRLMFENKDAKGIHRLAKRMTEREFAELFNRCMDDGLWGVKKLAENRQCETALHNEP